jgi:hypothetical protein
MGESLFGGGTSKINQNSSSITNLNANQDANTNGTQNSYNTQGQGQTNGQTTDQGQHQTGVQRNDQTNYQNTNQTNGQTQNGIGTTTGSSNVAAWQMPYITSGLDQARALLGQQSGTPFQGLDYTRMSPEQLTALNNLSGYANGAGGMLSGLSSQGAGYSTALGDARSGAAGILSSANSDPTGANISAASRYADNPYVQGMIKAAQTPIERQLNEVALPGLNSDASRTGNMDSSRAGVTEAILRRGAGESEANIASNILGQQYNNGLGLAENARGTNLNAGLGAVGALSGIGNAGSSLALGANSAALTNYGIPVQTGQAQQQDANNANQVNYQNFLGGQQFPWQSLDNYWKIAGNPLGTDTTGTTAQSGTTNGYTNGATTGGSNGVTNMVGDVTSHGNTSGRTDASGFTQGNTNSNVNQTGSQASLQSQVGNTTGTQTQPGPGILGGIAGLASGIGSLFAKGGLFSDRRLKDNIKKVGTLDNGLPVYSYNYKGDLTPRIGLMADEVEKVHPEAVAVHPSGFKMVHYGLAVR